MKLRILILFSCLLMAWGFLILRAAQIQIVPNAKLAKLKARQFEASLSIHTRRGAIVDRNGRELAASVPSYSLFVDPQVLKEPRTTSRKLAKFLRISQRNLFKKLTKKKNRFIWIARQLDEDTTEKIKALRNPGLGFVEEPKRIYPNGTLLAQVLGFVGRDGRGLEGLERSFNKDLSGELRQVMVARDARGRPLLSSASVFTEIPDGSDLQLTIDTDLQFELEKRLREVVERYDASSALGVILDVESSDILALGMTPFVDLNNPFRSSSKDRRNKVISDAFEPGSTLKPFLIAAALKEGVIKPNSKFYCEKGRMKVGRRIIREADSNHAFEWLTATEILAYSSNIGTTKIAFQLGAEKFRKHLREFGFGSQTGLNFPGEASGIVHGLPWNQHLLANISFGHGITTTPLQMAAAYAAIANGGVWRTPRLVKSIRSQKNREVIGLNVHEGKRIFDEELSAQLRMMLTVATGDQGTGKKARIPGFLVGGKTGTAQMVDFEKGGYKRGAYISSFAGFAPAHDPRFVIYISVENPKKRYYGSEVAAPVFAQMAQYAVRKLGLPPVILSEKNVVDSDGLQNISSIQEKAIQRVVQSDKTVFPDLKGLALREALKRIPLESSNIKIKGSGYISRTSPRSGEPWQKDKPVTLYLSEDH